jgi:hypothetical protein
MFKQGLDPTVHVGSPWWQRTSQEIRISDPFKPGNCYEYQSQLVQYVIPVSDQDYHHQPPTIVKLLPGGLNNRTDSVSLADTPSSSHSSGSGWQGSSSSLSSPTPGSRPSVQSTANSEGPLGKADSAATATADQVALSARVNIPSLHRALRPSPLRRSHTMRRGLVPGSSWAVPPETCAKGCSPCSSPPSRPGTSTTGLAPCSFWWHVRCCGLYLPSNIVWSSNVCLTVRDTLS